MQTEVIEIRTGGHEAVVALDREIERFLAAADAREGLLSVWVPHATAGLAVIETGAGSDADLLAALRDLLPAHDRWRHRHGSAGHGRDHVLPAIVVALARRAGARRPPGAGHVAVGVPRRHEPGQPRPLGPAVVPGRVVISA